MSGQPVLRVGTRRSPLALRQATLAADALRAFAPGIAIELVEIVSRGDRDARQLPEIGERGLFAVELEEALLHGRVDLAVHSTKDLTLVPSADLIAVAYLPREDPRDVLVTRHASVADLPRGARVATGSARRASALRTLRPDLEAVPVRGNVATRIERSRTRGDDACMLAAAGLARLALAVPTVVLPVDEVVPEAGQGAVVLQGRASTRAALEARLDASFDDVDHRPTRGAVELERALGVLLGGGCQLPVGVHVDAAGSMLHAFVAAAPGMAGVIAAVSPGPAPLRAAADGSADDAARELLPKLVERGLPLPARERAT